jgi:hypothetical protein
MKKVSERFIRYVVEPSRGRFGASYSCDLGDKKALSYAKTCADHFTTRGKVYGQRADKSYAFVYEWRPKIEVEPLGEPVEV